MVGSSEVWLFIGVYGPTVSEKKEYLWEEIDTISKIWNYLWIIRGDFNIVKCRVERSSRQVTRFEWKKFTDFIDEHCLLGIAREGPKVTFSNG